VLETEIGLPMSDSLMEIMPIGGWLLDAPEPTEIRCPNPRLGV